MNTSRSVFQGYQSAVKPNPGERRRVLGDITNKYQQKQSDDSLPTEKMHLPPPPPKFKGVEVKFVEEEPDFDFDFEPMRDVM